MLLNTKQLEELDGMQDVSDNLHDSIEDSNKFDESTESTMPWRRGMIEKAVVNVKNTSCNKINICTIYEIGSLLFDDKIAKFARVIRSKFNYLKLEYISGGSVVYSENKKKISCKIISKKNNIKIVKQEKIVKLSLNSNVKIENKYKKKLVKNKILKSINFDNLLDNQKKIQKNKIKIKKILSTFSVVNPIVNPNAYIQQKFQDMSNKEIASITGLSEHTIRRKLGEWGLRRIHRIKNKK